MHGFIDNNKNLQNKIVDGLNVYSLDYYLESGNSEPIIISTLNYWSEFEEQLNAQGLSNYLHYNILQIWDSECFPLAEECFDRFIEDAYINIKKYQKLRDMLTDEKSRIVLDELLKFRMTMDIKHTKKAFSLSIENLDRENQYFDPDIISFGSEEIFIDGGAYMGETSKSFINKLSKQEKEYQHIYVIEPDFNLIKYAQSELELYSHITYCPVGLSNKREMLRFSNTGDTGGTFEPNGEIVVELDTIDNITNCNATFIKLDIEGFEEKAILGAMKTIRKCKPKIAVCAYHKSGDIWKLCDTIQAIRNDYKIYLRHYTSAYFDTVLYFV